MDTSTGREVRLLSKAEFKSGVADIVERVGTYLAIGALLGAIVTALVLSMLGLGQMGRINFSLGMTLIGFILSSYFVWGVYTIALARVHFMHLISGKMLYYVDPTEEELKNDHFRVRGTKLSEAYDLAALTYADQMLSWQRARTISLGNSMASLSTIEQVLLYIVMMGMWKHAEFHLLHIGGGNESYFRKKDNHFYWVLIPKCTSYIDPWSEKPKAEDVTPSAASRDLSNTECLVGLSIIACFWQGYLVCGIGLVVLSSPFIVRRVLEARIQP